MLLAKIKDQCKRKRLRKYICPCKNEELVLCISVQRLFLCHMRIIMTVVAFVVKKYSNKFMSSIHCYFFKGLTVHGYWASLLTRRNLQSF